MKSNLRNEIKSYIVRSNKLQRESLRYVEAVQLADALGYDLVWQKRAKP